MTSLIAAIEVSTSKVRLLILSLDAVVKWVGYLPIGWTKNDDGCITQKPRRWISRIEQLFALAHADGVTLTDIKAVGVTSTTPTFVSVDSFGELSCPDAILWCDPHSVGRPNWNGTNSGLQKLLYWESQRANWFDPAKRVLDAGAFLLCFFTGELVSIEASLVQKLGYCDERFDLTGFEDIEGISIERAINRLPKRVLQTGAACGRAKPIVAERLGLSRNTMFFCCAFDSAMALVGAGVTKPSRAFVLSIGTSVTFNLVPVEQDRGFAPWTDTKGILMGSLRTVTGGITSGGKSLEIVHEELGLTCAASQDSDLEELATANEMKCDASCVGVVGGLMRAPLLGKSLRTRFTAEMNAMDPTAKLTALRRGVACYTRFAIENLRVLGTAVEEVRIVGGGAKSNCFCTLVSNITNLRVRQFDSDAAAMGTALVAGSGYFAGTWLDEVIDSVIRRSRLRWPSEDKRELYNNVYDNYTKLLEGAEDDAYAQ